MSKHWNPKRGDWAGQRDRHRWPPVRHTRSVRRATFSGGEVRLTILGGIFLGLAYTFIPSGEVALASGGTQVSDPWAVSITDGDTFRYRGEKIRIADIDTPEVDGRCAYEKRLAARATERMEELLHAGAFEMHPIDREEDKYGRKLRIVSRDGQSLGDQLVSEGLARTWSGRREPWC